MPAKLLAELTQGKSPICILGMGYVGLPLACLFARKFRVTGFDIDQARIDELKTGIDKTLEIEDPDLLRQPNLEFTTDPESIRNARIIIVAVPTPIDRHKKPDLRPILGSLPNYR